MERPIGPINAAVPTPLLPEKTLDEASLRTLCTHCHTINLDGIFLLGSMGEGNLLPERDRERAVVVAREALANDITLFVGVSDVSTARMAERAERYAALGADYVIFTIPQNVSIDKGIEELHAFAGKTSARCGYYEVPAATGRTLSFNQLKRLLGHPNVHVFKDSSNNALIAQAVSAGLLTNTHVKILDGVEFRTAFSAALGYDGVLHGGGALTARRVRRIWELATQGDLAEAMRLDRENCLFLAGIYDRFLTATRATIGQKFALTQWGVFAHETLLLDQDLDAEARARIESTLRRHERELFDSARK